jgi:uncharacterized membrane protein
MLRLFKRDLHKQSHAWVEEGLISESQAEAICQHYGLDYHDKAQHSIGYYVLVSLGYLFIGLAVITLIGENWDNIPRAIRMGGLIALTLAVNVTGLQAWLKEKSFAPIAWFFLGGIMYGASIMLIAQIYHIGEHYPDGVFWWAMGILPVALLLRSNLIMTLVMALAFTWFFVESSLNFFPYLFPVFLAALAWQVLRVKPNILLFLVLLVGFVLYIEYLVSWHNGKYYHYDVEIENVFIGAVLFVFYFGMSVWMESRSDHAMKDYGETVRVWTARLGIVVLLIMSFKEPWRELFREEWTYSGLVVSISIGLVGASVGLALAGTRSLEKSSTTLIFAVVYLLVLTSALTVPHKYAVIAQILTNLVLIAIGVYLIIQGIRGGVTHYFYLGVFTVLATGLLRYIDLVGDYIGATILFGVFAAILLFSARYWKNYLAKQGAEL